MASQNEQRSVGEVEAMTLDERRAAIRAGVIRDVDAAPDDVQTFAQRATRRYLATFVND